MVAFRGRDDEPSVQPNHAVPRISSDRPVPRIRRTDAPGGAVMLRSRSAAAGLATSRTRERSRFVPKIEHLTERAPKVSVDDLLDGFYPSPRFGEVSFDTYRPDPHQPSQAAAVTKLREFAVSVNEPEPSGLRKLFGGGRKAVTRAGLYLDGGFGVGKTHLLASLGTRRRARRPSAPSSSTPTSWGL